MKEALSYTKKEDILSIIEELCDYIIKHLDKCDDMSLVRGQAGIAIALYHAGNLLKKEKYYNTIRDVYKFIYKNFEKLPNSSFGYGIAGVLWSILYLHRQKIETGIAEEFDDFDIYFKQYSKSVQRYDLFTGLIGYGQYFIMRNADNHKDKNLEMIIKYLIKSSINLSIGRSWIYINPFDGTKVYDLGLAHGIPSIISFLCKTFNLISMNASIMENKINEIFKILEYSENFDNSFCHFPYYINLDLSVPKDSKWISTLGWCYGDLGIASVFMQAGITFNNNKWIDKAKSIILTTTRRKLEDCSIQDISLCHGASGAVHLYNKYYKYYRSSEMLSARNYWLEVLFHMKRKEKDLSGCYYFTKGKFIQRYGILSGFAGVILTLTALIDENYEKWDSFMLL